RGKVECQFNLTTPDPLTLHALFSRALSAEITAVVMEASSHALQQQRVADVAFDVGVFTNLTQDHLDYHGDMQSYLDAKMTLFTLVNRNQKGKRGAVVNVDSPEGCRVLEYCQKLDLNLIGFGRSELADLKMEEFSQSLAGSRFKVSYNGTSFQINSRFIGEHNAYNICGSLAVLELLGIGLRQSAPLCYELRQVPGRLEAVGDETLGIYVDYAHTPDALLNVLSALRQLAKKKLWVVFGCGGDRDRSKRPVMAKVARELADKVIVTSDNPRSENPHTIISEILAGGVRADFVEVDRGLAINTAIHEAERGDVILIAGKGHEDYQIIGNEKLHFSDVEVARAAFIERKCA
ncbi:MAG: UDP-N-acetylmuramoyl-L-alanyl-D-glutamate--2,6-diaminopimelate ligase, partial [Bdellovibrionales bacterium]|nr:UDP-N-acetylmuramoyl-L-alanyl-D-glutamate--2,6-diaminopimelate ligase [Bdellovibrionales bacterium]